MLFADRRRLNDWELFELVGGSGAARDMSVYVAADALYEPFALTRTGNAATALNGDNAGFTTYAANAPRFNGSARGLLLEGQRTNLFLNAAVGVTQNVTVTAALHQLSFYGTGSITLTGASTAGPLNGTGANNRVVLSFTPTAGTLTLTIAGDVRMVMLEAAPAPASSFVATTSASLARGSDVCSATLGALGLPATGACTVIATFILPITPSGTQNLIRIDDGTGNNRVGAIITASNIVLQRSLAAASANSSALAAHTAGNAFKIACAFDGTGRSAGSVGGAAAVALTGGPSSGLTRFRLGVDSSNGGNLFGECRFLRILPTVASDADLAVLSA